jgi:hypothetical protein
MLMENLEGINNSEDLHGKIILKWIREKACEGANSIHIAQDRNQWQALVNTVMKSVEFLD